MTIAASRTIDLIQKAGSRSCEMKKNERLKSFRVTRCVAFVRGLSTVDFSIEVLAYFFVPSDGKGSSSRLLVL